MTREDHSTRPASEWRRRSERFVLRSTLRGVEKGGPCNRELMQLVTCIDKGLAHTQATLEEVARDVVELRLVYSTLDPDLGSTRSRRADFDEIAFGYRATP